MYNSLHRRDFLKTTAMVSVGSLALRARGADEPGPQAAASGARLLPGCCAYSYGSYLGKGKMTMEQFIVKAVELGVLGVDITTYWLKSTDPAYLAGLRNFAYRQGMPLLRAGDWRRPLPAGGRQTRGDNRDRQEMGGRDGIARGLPFARLRRQVARGGERRARAFNGWSRR